VGTRQHFDRLSDQAEGKKDFSRKGGYQGGFGINPLLLFPGKNHDFCRGEAFLPQAWYEA
jgi:hypothetical protein